MDLFYKDTTTQEEKELLAIIGEAYLAMTNGSECDEAFWRNRLEEADSKLDEIVKQKEEAKKIVDYAAYKYADTDEEWEVFESKEDAIDFAKVNGWSVVMEFVYEDKEYFEVRIHEDEIKVWENTNPIYRYKEE